MPIFPILELETTVQVNDKTRIDGSKSFISKGEAAVTLVRIKPETSGSFITVTGTTYKDWYLDWQFSTDGNKTVTIEITTDGSPVTVTKTLSVVTEASDKLFSTDDDLVGHESDILKYVRAGRATFKDKHRVAQDLIMKWLDEHRYTDSNGNRLTKAVILDIEEVRSWSKFLTLQIIFSSLSNAIDDIFAKKSELYNGLMSQARNRAILRLDLNGDSSISDSEKLDNMSYFLLKR